MGAVDPLVSARSRLCAAVRRRPSARDRGDRRAAVARLLGPHHPRARHPRCV